MLRRIAEFLEPHKELNIVEWYSLGTTEQQFLMQNALRLVDEVLDHGHEITVAWNNGLSYHFL